MAMNGNTMGDEVVAAINALTEADKQNFQIVMRTMFTAVVAHITANAVTSTPNVQGGGDTKPGTIT